MLGSRGSSAQVSYPFSMSESRSTKVKGGALLSRLTFVREQHGEEGVQRVLAQLPAEDRQACSHILTGAWYPFELNERLDSAVAAEMTMGDKVFLLMGEKSAAQNPGGPLAPCR